MANTQDANATPAKVRKDVAEKHFVDSAGKECEIEKATGVWYKSLPDNTEKTFQIPGIVAGSVVGMLACFGATTLATNTASGNRQALERGSADALPNDADAVLARFERIQDNEWGTKAGGGFRIDIDTLYAAVVENRGGSEPPVGKAAWYAKVEAEPATAAALRKHSAIAPIYDRIMREKRNVPEKPLGEAFGDSGLV